MDIQLEDEKATITLGQALGEAIQQEQDALVQNDKALGSELNACNSVIYMEGVLGAGKTTFCRGVLTSLGHQSHVKSPTYTLVEPYIFKTDEFKRNESTERSFYHFDLYRLGDPEELEYMGIRDYFQSNNICLIEWPSKGEGYIAKADITITLIPDGRGRKASIQWGTELGKAIYNTIDKILEKGE